MEGVALQSLPQSEGSNLQYIIDTNVLKLGERHIPIDG